jgi:putative phosphoribosyl transferase
MEIVIQVDSVALKGILSSPEKPQGIILFVHGSGSSRLSPRNNFVANILNKSNFATLLIDLLSEEEDQSYETRFDIHLLTQRVIQIIDWIKKSKNLHNLGLGLFGASTGAAAALEAACLQKQAIKAVVSRGGRPDLAMNSLPSVTCPTLLIVGGNDPEVVQLNQIAYDNLHCSKKLEIIPSATHLFEEPGCLQKVAELASGWFTTFLTT